MAKEVTFFFRHGRTDLTPLVVEVDPAGNIDGPALLSSYIIEDPKRDIAAKCLSRPLELLGRELSEALRKRTVPHYPSPTLVVTRVLAPGVPAQSLPEPQTA